MSEIEKKILDHDYNNKYIIVQEFNISSAENFGARLKQGNFALKADIDDFVEKTDFHDKLKILNKKVTSNETKHGDAEKKPTGLTKKVLQFQKRIWHLVR